ncbi:uncharacterized protein EI97DRAFT_85844 [Westerdykella ornata]|uniref:Alpha/beta-hydrolase n=1 Tax=Westerdykella ornata TaxID=318751 RepID=A0A6A6JFW3_WESOR|nr:uncharacterized protein EI97DRAFT_85844 [Westerdykella ornata]KAF2275043.1 hypothetical protein EI97DRAFT_85844 [Westerdykella ornata]
MHRPRPEPKYSFTIPSVHDDTRLDCRIYHPGSLEEGLQDADRSMSLPSGVEDAGKLGIGVGEAELGEHASTRNTKWRRRGIVVAHPYAPLGGSYDDRVVGIVVEEFVRMGWIVGTFCFRGAHESQGRTSWTGRPEVRDYISFTGCFMLYLSFLHPCPSSSLLYSPSPLQAPSSSTSNDSTIILSGYSHGSLILQHLPHVPSILQHFVSPVQGSAASEIVLRAKRLAEQTNTEWKALTLARAKEREEEQERGREAIAKTHAHDRNRLCVTMGGEETAPEVRRSSREIRRSIEGRRSLELGSRLRGLSFGRKGLHDARKGIEVEGGEEDDGAGPDPSETQQSASSSKNTTSIPTPSHIYYLLISPLTPPLSYFLAPGLHSLPFWPRRDNGKSHRAESLMQHDSLVLFGDQDVFSSAKRIRAWVERLREGGGKVEAVEVNGAGHFWVGEQVEAALRGEIRRWGSAV